MFWVSFFGFVNSRHKYNNQTEQQQWVAFLALFQKGLV